MQSADELGPLTRRLIALASDEVDDDQYERPLSLILDFWRKDPSQCEQAILQSVAEWNGFPALAGDVQVAATEIQDAKYLDLLEQCTRAKSIPTDSKLCLLLFLAKSGSHVALSRYVDEFRKTVRNICAGNEDATKIFLFQFVREICLLHLSEMKDSLQALVHFYDAHRARKYIFDFLTKCQIDAALVWFEQGAEAVAARIREPGTKDAMRAGCIFCLGCEASDRYYSDFVRCYEEYRNRWFVAFDVEMACVEAIVYSASTQHLQSFLGSALEAKAARTLRKRVFDAGLGLLLRAVYYTARIDSGIKKQVELCLQARNRSIAALAWLVLRKQGIDVEPYDQELEEAIGLERQYLREQPPLMMSMARVRVRRQTDDGDNVAKNR